MEQIQFYILFIFHQLKVMMKMEMLNPPKDKWPKEKEVMMGRTQEDLNDQEQYLLRSRDEHSKHPLKCLPSPVGR